MLEGREGVGCSVGSAGIREGFYLRPRVLLSPDLPFLLLFGITEGVQSIYSHLPRLFL